MTKPDLTPTLLRLAKLEERLKNVPKKQSRFAWLNDPAKIISVAAFVISLMTTAYSWRKDNLSIQLANRRNLDATIEQFIDIAIKNCEFAARNRNDPNLGAMTSWFTAQTGLMANKAALDLAELKSGSLVDYLMVGTTLQSAGEFAKASQVYRSAIQAAQQKKAESESIVHRMTVAAQSILFGKDRDSDISDEHRPNDLASAHVSLGSSLYGENKTGEAEAQYAEALGVISESSLLSDHKGYQSAYVHKFWAETLVNQQGDCRAAKPHFESAAQLFPAQRKNDADAEWKSIEYELAFVAANCGANGKMQGNSVAPVTPADGIFTSPTPSPNSLVRKRSP